MSGWRPAATAEERRAALKTDGEITPAIFRAMMAHVGEEISKSKGWLSELDGIIECSGATFDEEEFLARNEQNVMARCYFYIYKTQLLYMMGDFELARDYARQAAASGVWDLAQTGLSWYLDHRFEEIGPIERSDIGLVLSPKK